MNDKTILVLHGMTMSGASMLELLGPIGTALQNEGFSLIAPDGPRAIPAEGMAGLLQWARPQFAARGQDVTDVFCDGVFWKDGAHYDWFDPHTDPESGLKTYRVLEASLDTIRDATRGRDVVGVLGFSQGCALAALVCGLAKRGEFSFGKSLRFGCFFGGFRPLFDVPALDPWPVGDLSALVVTGEEDAIFHDPTTLETLAALFDAPEVHRPAGVRHTVPTGPEWVERVVRFAAKSLEHTGSE